MKDTINKLKEALISCDAVLIGAGSGLSTAAGYTYTGQRFKDIFADFIELYHFKDMYTAGFYPFSTAEEYWAYWSRYVWINRYQDPTTPIYDKLLGLVKDKDYFVLTTNVDHCFQRAGFDKQRLFYIQGDYGLFQCSKPCHSSTYDNEETIKQMLLAQGYEIGLDFSLKLPEGKRLERKIPASLIPHCPRCNRSMMMNLRSDNRFVQDDGWHQAAKRYEQFIHKHQSIHILYLEIGVGYNTPSIIKYNFWQQVSHNPSALYVCINADESSVPTEIASRSICIKGDAALIINSLSEEMGKSL